MTFIVDGASQCRQNWEQYGTACYYLNSDTLTWENAQAYCETQGGSLASIADSGVNSHVQSVMSGYSKAHIGRKEKRVDQGFQMGGGGAKDHEREARSPYGRGPALGLYVVWPAEGP